MIDLKRVRGIALDIAGADRSYEWQDEVSEFIWHLLSRHYRIYLFSSNSEDTLADEDFSHPRLSILREEMPPSRAVLEAHPELRQPETLWITDDPALQDWIRAAELPFIHLRHHEQALAGGQQVTHLAELGALLHPTALLLRDFTALVDDLRRFRPQGALLVGIGGPPRSGFQQFALDLRAHLQDAGHELVDLMDLSTLMRSTESLLEAPDSLHQVWVSAEAERWLREDVLEPLRSGAAVYLERPPPTLPADFGAHFPFYVSNASVLLLFGELLFTQGVADRLDLSILLEVSPEETTRRLYEIPAGETFDSKFSEQYMSREGAIYKAYLERNGVRERASLRIDANREGAFFLDERAGRPLV
jgi:hypothetical protein